MRTIITSRGVITTKNGSGLGISKDSDNSGFSPFSLSTKTAVDGDVLTVADAGLITVTVSEAGAEVALPAAADCAGSTFVFRAGNTNAANIVTGSTETTVKPITDGTSNSFRVTMANVADSSVAMVSDGTNFLVLGQSGSLTFI